MVSVRSGGGVSRGGLWVRGLGDLSSSGRSLGCAAWLHAWKRLQKKHQAEYPLHVTRVMFTSITRTNWMQRSRVSAVEGAACLRPVVRGIKTGSVFGGFLLVSCWCLDWVFGETGLVAVGITVSGVCRRDPGKPRVYAAPMEVSSATGSRT